MLFVVEKWSDAELPFQYLQLSLQNFTGWHAPGPPSVAYPLGKQVANGHHCFGNPFSPGQLRHWSRLACAHSVDLRSRLHHVSRALSLETRLQQGAVTHPGTSPARRWLTSVPVHAKAAQLSTVNTPNQEAFFHLLY